MIRVDPACEVLSQDLHLFCATSKSASGGEYRDEKVSSKKVTGALIV